MEIDYDQKWSSSCPWKETFITSKGEEKIYVFDESLGILEKVNPNMAQVTIPVN